MAIHPFYNWIAASVATFEQSLKTFHPVTVYDQKSSKSIGTIEQVYNRDWVHFHDKSAWDDTQFKYKAVSVIDNKTDILGNRRLAHLFLQSEYDQDIARRHAEAMRELNAA